MLSQLMYTSYPCQDEEDEMLIIAPYGDYNLVDPATGTTSGINLINTGFLSGTYSGTMFSGPSAAGPSSGGGASGSGGTNDPNIFPNFTDGLDNFFNSIGSAFSDAYEWTGNTIRTIFRWIRNLFCGSCGPRLSMARGPANPITIIDDNAPPASTPAPLESCDWFYTNFALFHVNTLVGYNPNTNLTPTVLNWWDLTASKAVKVSLLNFLYRNPTISQNTWEVFFQIVDYLMNGGDTSVVQSFLNIAKLSDLNLNFYYSLSSPANIDDSAIDKTTPEGQKFDCIYKILMQSPSFKNLFNDTFGGNQSKLNVKFEIADNLPASTSGVCILLSSNNGNHSNLIRINKNILAGTNVKSNFKIAKTILHECIHAYLNIKKINCNLGSNIDELNGLDLQELIGTFYQSFGCHIDVNGSPQSQHEFMFNHLVPTFQNIFSEIRDLLASQSSINYVSNSTYVNSINNQNFSWNWNDFYKYFSLEGLHQCESFVQNIAQVPLENFYYEFYRTEAQQFSKDCQ